MYYLEKSKLANNQAVLDEMVDTFVDKISEIFSARKYFRLIFESDIGNIPFTIRRKRRRFDKKQEKFLFEVINQKANQIYEVFSENLAFACNNYYPQDRQIVRKFNNHYQFVIYGFDYF